MSAGRIAAVAHPPPQYAFQATDGASVGGKAGEAAINSGEKMAEVVVPA